MEDVVFSGITYFQYKAGVAYEVTFPETLRDDAKSLSWEHRFDTTEFDSGMERPYYVMLRRPLCAVKDPVERAIIAVRALYTLLGTSQTDIIVEDAERPIKLLPDEDTNRGDVRHQLLRYITERHDVIFDQPYRVMEFVGAIRCNVASLLRQLEWLDHEKLLMFDLSALQKSRPRAPESVLRYRMKLDSNRLEGFIKRTESPPKDRSHLYYKLLDTLTELDGDFAFVLMPFNEDEFPQAIYHEVIKPLVKDVLGINCVIVTEDPTSKSGQDKIYSHMVKSKLVIVEVSTQNPNVMFEFGQSTILEKEFILTCYNKYAQNKDKKLAFDYANIHTLFYEDPDQLRDKLRKSLEAFKKMQPKQVT